MGDADPGGAGVRRAVARSRGSVAAVPGQDDRSEPGAGDTADRAVPREWAGEGTRLSAAPVRLPVHGRRHPTVGGGGRGGWNSERAGDAKDSLPRVSRLWRSALSEVVIDIGTAHLQPA